MPFSNHFSPLTIHHFLRSGRAGLVASTQLRPAQINSGNPTLSPVLAKAAYEATVIFFISGFSSVTGVLRNLSHAWRNL
jgi:hypothetical protein